jgi:GNAT superfamily N-acetyltransferase
MENNVTQLKTRAGVSLNVRPVTASDQPFLAEFFTHVTKEDLRFRYLVGIDHVSKEKIAELVDIDHARVENYLAFGAGDTPLIATAVLACDPNFDRAEVAITIREDFKNLGIGWELLSFLADAARKKGVKILESIEERDNHAAIELERHMGFTTEAVPDDPTLIIVRKELAKEPAL